MLGTHLYRDISPVFFGNFASSMFSMFQVLTGDSWASISRSMFNDPEGSTQPDITAFFVTYILIASVMLLNVIIAVLLDEFNSCVQREAREAWMTEVQESKMKSMDGMLDIPLLSLTNFQTEQDLRSRIDEWYRLLDVNESGGVSFEVCARCLSIESPLDLETLLPLTS